MYYVHVNEIMLIKNTSSVKYMNKEQILWGFSLKFFKMLYIKEILYKFYVLF